MGDRAGDFALYLEDVACRQLPVVALRPEVLVGRGVDRLAECDAVVICVPTPLGKHREPDLSFIRSTVEEVAKRLRSGQLIVLESTTYPGTTREIMPSETWERINSLYLSVARRSNKDLPRGVRHSVLNNIIQSCLMELLLCEFPQRAITDHHQAKGFMTVGVLSSKPDEGMHKIHLVFYRLHTTHVAYNDVVLAGEMIG